MPIQILADTGGIARTNCYLVVDEATRQAVLFDAPDHTIHRLLDHVAKKQLQLIGLWLTHGHFDHLADHAVVRERFPSAKILIHKLDEPKLLKPGSRIFPLPFTIPPGHADGFVEDGEELAIGETKLRVLFTPGHSPGHVGYHFEGDKVLIGGDLIIGGAVGRTDLPDSNEEDLNASVRKIMALPPETMLFSGHGEPGTLAEEAETNPYVRRILRGS